MSPRGYTAHRILQPGVEKLKTDGDISPHSLRHACATWLLEAGALPMYVASHLGQSSPQITMQTNASLLKDIDATAMARIGRWHDGLSEVLGVAKPAGNNEDVGLDPWEMPADYELDYEEETRRQKAYSEVLRAAAVEEASAQARLGTSAQPGTTDGQPSAVGEE